MMYMLIYIFIFAVVGFFHIGVVERDVKQIKNRYSYYSRRTELWL